MADLSVPTKVIVTNIVGGSVSLDIISVTTDESFDGTARAHIETSTAPPAWYANEEFPVNSLVVQVDSTTIFTGYVLTWERVEGADTFGVEAMDVLFVAEREWLLPTDIVNLLPFVGNIADLVIQVLQTNCEYASVVRQDMFPFIVGTEEKPFEYGLESVADLINRVNSVIQTSLWANHLGVVYWGWRDRGVDNVLTASSGVAGGYNYGLDFLERNPPNIFNSLGGAYRTQLNARYATHNAAGTMLATHRQSAYPGETASHPTRGNLLEWSKILDEEPYRTQAVVFGLPPFQAAYPATEVPFPYTPLDHISNTAIVSSSLLQSQGICYETARRLYESTGLRRTIRWQALGNANFHAGTEHFIDCPAYYGLGKVISVAHTVDGSGYTISGESEIRAAIPMGEGTWVYEEQFFHGGGGGCTRYDLCWEIEAYVATKTENVVDEKTHAYPGTATTRRGWYSDAADWTLNTDTYRVDYYEVIEGTPYYWESCEAWFSPGFNTATVYPVDGSGEKDLASPITVQSRGTLYAFVMSGSPGGQTLGGIWYNQVADYQVAKHTDGLSYADIRANWHQMVTLADMEWALRVYYWNVRQAGRHGGDCPIEKWHETWGGTDVGFEYGLRPDQGSDIGSGDWTPQSIRALVTYPAGRPALSMRWAVMAGGFTHSVRTGHVYHGEVHYLLDWYPSMHIITFTMGPVGKNGRASCTVEYIAEAYGGIDPNLNDADGRNSPSYAQHGHIPSPSAGDADNPYKYAGFATATFGDYMTASTPAYAKQADISAKIVARPLYWSYGAALTGPTGGLASAHGFYWPDSGVRQMGMYGQDPQLAYASNIVRQTTAQSVWPRAWTEDRFAHAGRSPKYATNDAWKGLGTAHYIHPSGSGGLTFWSGVALWSRMKLGNGYTRYGHMYDFAPESLDMTTHWYGPDAPFPTNYQNLFLYLPYIFLCEGKLGHQRWGNLIYDMVDVDDRGCAQALWLRAMIEDAVGTLYEPAAVPYEQDSEFRTLVDLSLGDYNTPTTKMLHGANMAHYALGRRFLPIRANYAAGSAYDGLVKVREWKGWRVDNIGYPGLGNITPGPSVVMTLPEDTLDAEYGVQLSKNSDEECLNRAVVATQSMRVDSNGALEFHFGAAGLTLEF